MNQQKKNYDKILIRQIERIPEGTVPKLLLHVCCGPCASYVLEWLSAFFEIHLLYYNPNIAPKGEYDRRLQTLQALCRQLPMKHPVHFLETDYRPQLFLDSVRGLEQEPEGGLRCKRCYAMRLEEAARRGKEWGCDYFTTSLTISPMKNPEIINGMGEAFAEQYGIAYLPGDFKKRGGYQRSIQLCKIYDLYRQRDCGCVYSRGGGETEDGSVRLLRSGHTSLRSEKEGAGI